MTQSYHTDTLLDNALALVARGVKLFPCHRVIERAGTRICTCGKDDCKSAGKHPRTKNGSEDATDRPGQIRAWAKQWPGRVNFGQDLTGRLVVDIDVADGKTGPETLRELLSLDQLSELGKTCRIRTGRGGTQYLFTIPAELETDGLRDKLGPGVDIKRGARHYVMVPGSVTDAEYRYDSETGDDTEHPAPGWLLEMVQKDLGKNGKAKTRNEDFKLDLPADSPERGNSWTKSMTGVLAIKLWPDWSMYLRCVLNENAQSTDPLPEDQVTKMCLDTWEREERAHKQRSVQGESGIPTAEAGFLAGGYADFCLRVGAAVKDGDPVAVWSNFDPKCVGVAIDGESRSYELEVYKARDRTRFRTAIDDDTLADPRKLAAWRAGLGLTIYAPENAVQKAITPGARLQAFFEYQNPPRATAVDHLGWVPSIELQAPGFVTFDHIIRAGGAGELVGVRPLPHLRGWGKWSYGFDGEMQDALDVLRWVMEFREETPAGVFAAWLTSLVLKGQFESELFPIFSIESSRETGKSVGFFAMMLQLFGNARGPGQGTYASTRDELSSNGNGAVWLDDLTKVDDRFGELLRESVVSGSVTKKAANNKDTADVRLRSGLLITGEGLGSAGLDPALLDRFVRLGELASVKQRMSRRISGAAQIADLEQLQRRYPVGGGGLSAVAGWVVQRILQVAEGWGAGELQIGQWRTETGRIGAGNGILRMGARVFAEAIGSDAWVGDVDAFCAERKSEDVRPFFEAEILPYVWRNEISGNRFASKTMGRACVWIDTDSGQIFINVGACTDEWNRKPNLTDREKQLGSIQRIGADLNRMGADRVQKRVTDLGAGAGAGAGAARVWIRVLSRKVTERVLGDME